MSTSFEVPKRQHPLGVLIIGAQFTWKSVQASWPILIGASFGELQWYHLMVIPAGLVLVGAFALLYYLRFHFYISSDALIVERGIFQRERLQIPFDRIKAVQLFQGPIQQVFGLTGVRVDTAGSSGSELELVAIRKSEASILQKFLYDKMLQATPLEEEHVEHDTDRDEDSRQPLVSLDMAGLLKVGLSQNHFKNAFLGLALFMSLFQGAEEQVAQWLDGVPIGIMSVVGLTSVLLFIPGLVVMGMVGVLTSLGSAALRYWKLNSTLGQDGLKLQMGLLRRNTFDVPFDKIHMTEWKSNWIRRMLGYETVRIRQAQALGSGGLRVFIPAMEPVHRSAMEEALYQDMNPESLVFDVVPARRLRWLLLAAASIPALLLLIAPSVWHIALATVWLAFVFWTTERRFQSYRLRVHTDAIVLEKGWFWRSRTVLKMSQLQGVEWKRNALLERRKIGHLIFHTAAGGRSFDYVPRGAAEQVRDFALNQLHVAQEKRKREHK